MRKGEGLKDFSAVKKLCNVKSVSLDAEEQLYERTVAATAWYGARN